MLFSVIIATHHRTNAVTHALSSLLLQTYPHWEAIIVDAGNLGLEKNIGAILHEDRRIRYVQRPESHVRNGKAYGISAARGDVITFIDNNDYFSPTHLEAHAEILQNNPRVDMLMGKPTVIGSPLKSESYGKAHINHGAVGGTFFIRDHVFDSIATLGESSTEDDSDLVQMITEHGFVAQKIPMPTYIYNRSREL